jgi:peptide/nickel transport system substrate-binding protein
MIEEGRSVMEEAGYGPNNMYETSMMYPSDSQASEWETFAQLLRDLSQSIHIDLSLESAPASTLTNRAIDGNFDIYAVFNALTWMEADATLQYAYPNPYTWTRWGQGDGGMSQPAQTAAEAWERYSENRVPTEEAQEARNELYIELEEANWNDMTELPLWHPTDQTYWYDWVEGYQINGPMSRPTFNEVSLNERS